MSIMNDKIILFGIICGSIGLIGLLTIIGILIAKNLGVVQVCIYTCLVLMGTGYIICEIGDNKKLWEE